MTLEQAIAFEAGWLPPRREVEGIMPVNLSDIGCGPTEELSLRVSAAALVRVVFSHPKAGRPCWRWTQGQGT